MKTYAEINEKIKKGTAVVLTAEEVSELSKTLSPKEFMAYRTRQCRSQRNCRKSRRSNHRHFRSDVFFGCIFEFRSFQSPYPDGEDRIERRPG